MNRVSTPAIVSVVMLAVACACSNDEQPSAASNQIPTTVAHPSGRVAFSYDDGIWISDADGSNRVQLTHDGGFDPTWSPDGNLIVYRTLTEADDGELWVMDADGNNARDVVDDPDFSDWGPSFSPDGRTIAFNSNRLGGLAIWVMGADGSDQHLVTHGHGEYPTWSPDGKQIAYAGGSYYDIRRTNADGSDDTLVVGDPAYEMGPAWSPDGQWLAYHTQADFTTVGERGMGPEMEIHVVHPDGTGDRRVTNDHVEDSFPTWSPDGNFLMWSRHGQLVIGRLDGSPPIAVGAGNFPSWIE